MLFYHESHEMEKNMNMTCKLEFVQGICIAPFK